MGTTRLYHMVHMNLIQGSSYSILIVHSRREVVHTLQVIHSLQLFHNITIRSIYKIYLQNLKNKISVHYFHYFEVDLSFSSLLEIFTRCSWKVIINIYNNGNQTHTKKYELRESQIRDKLVNNPSFLVAKLHYERARTW